MPANDYAPYAGDKWSITVVLATRSGDVHEITSPLMPLAKAEECIEAMREWIEKSWMISLGWLSAGGGDVVAAYITR